MIFRFLVLKSVPPWKCLQKEETFYSLSFLPWCEHEILVIRLRIKAKAEAVRAKSPNYLTTKQSPLSSYLFHLTEHNLKKMFNQMNALLCAYNVLL